MIIDKRLPKKLRKAIVDLQADDDFQDIFAKDKKLDDLYDKQFCIEDEILSLQLLASGKMNVRGFDIYGLSPLSISLLWLSKNKVLKDISEMTTDEIDVVIFMIFCNDIPMDLAILKERSKNFCIDNNITAEDAIELILTSMKLAFLPLKQIYTTTEVHVASDPVFDTNWLASIIASVTRITKMKPEEILRTPLNSCYHYYLEWLKENHIRNIDRVPEEEVLKQIDLRACELVIDYLVSKKTIRKTMRKKYLKIISNGLSDDYDKDKL